VKQQKTCLAKKLQVWYSLVSHWKLATAADAEFRLLPISTIVGNTYGNCGQATRRSELTQMSMNYLFFMDYQPPLKSRPMILEAQEEEFVVIALSVFLPNICRCKTDRISIEIIFVLMCVHSWLRIYSFRVILFLETKRRIQWQERNQ
jgi:hypothetical protein